MKSKLKYLLLLPLVLYVLLNLSGCFRFRLSHQKAIDFFNKSKVVVEFKYGPVNSQTGRKLYLAETEDNTKDNYILFVHGSPGSGSNFYEFLKDTSLLRIAQIAAVDRPGFGYSQLGIAVPNITWQAQMLADILTMHKHQNIFLVGHSLGGPVIVKTAMMFPELVDGLFIVAGSVDPSLEPKEPWRKPMHSPWLRWMMPASFRASNDEIIPLKAQLEAMENQWNRVLCPVFVLQGAKDKLVPVGNADFISSKIPQNRQTIVKLPEANHFIPFTSPQLMRNYLIQFIEAYGKEKN